MRRYEIEQKYKIVNPEALRRKLQKLKARKIRSGREENIFWDRQSFLKKKGSALRLRRAGKHAWLTFKGRRIGKQLSKRLELETPVDFRMTQMLLKQLGFREKIRYSKQRAEYRLAGCLVTVDHLRGLGWFAEIEGAPGRIRRLENKLGFLPDMRESRTYLQLILKK